jgi:hypothetical protein
MQSQGGASRDETLRSTLVSFANDAIDEIDRRQRWLLSFAEPTVTTASGTQAYTLPFPAPTAGSGLTSNLYMQRAYWEDANGRINRMLRYSKEELQRLYGDPTGSNPNTGQPKYFAVEPTTSQSGGALFGSPQMQLIVYPCPDGSGPVSGNYVIHVSGYWETPSIIETTGTISGPPTTTLTVQSGPFLTTANAIPSDGTGYGLTVSVRGAGFAQSPTVNDDHTTQWSLISGNAVTLSLAAQTAVSSAQVFFNSTNWIIRHFPKVLLFGMLREIANYYGNLQDYPVWEARFQEQVEQMSKYDFDRSRGVDQEAVAVPGQLASSLRRLEGFSTIDVRGGAF